MECFARGAGRGFVGRRWSPCGWLGFGLRKRVCGWHDRTKHQAPNPRPQTTDHKSRGKGNKRIEDRIRIRIRVRIRGRVRVRIRVSG